MSRWFTPVWISFVSRTGITIIMLCFITAASRLEGLAQATKSSFYTTVTPKFGEDVEKPCEYEMRIVSANQRIRGLFVVFERGPELQHFYDQPEIEAFVKKHHLAMLMPFNCASKNHGDIDVDPDQGLGRALFTAIDQFSLQTNHPELRSAPLLLMGFSGAGALVGRLVGFAPNRISAAILSHAGQVPPFGLNTINLSGAALAVPELILVGGKDKIVGTESGYAYFSKYWQLGAPWLFAIQNDAGHFCNLDATDLILAWLGTILENSRLSKTPVSVRSSNGYYAFFRKKQADSLDSGSSPLTEAIDLVVQRPVEGSPEGKLSSGWLPTKEVALTWETFTNLPDHHASAKQ